MMKFYSSLIVLFFGACLNFIFAQDTQTVGGTVSDMKTKRDVSKLKLEIRKLDGSYTKATQTDSDGMFEFKEIPVGKYSLSVVDKDFNKKSFNFETTVDHKPNLDFSAERKVTWMFNWGDYKGQEHYWAHFTAKIILGIYLFCLLLVFFYSMMQLTLSLSYARYKRKVKNNQLIEDVKVYDGTYVPRVTIQLPMFNELYVAERIIEETAKFDYPRDRFEIQVLDDSTDETVDVIAKKVAEVAATGVDIKHIHRVDRSGYKAGALDAAMDRVTGEFIVIFDSDFVPEKDFLKKTIPYFQDPKVGIVQTRWGHINKDFSLLTELQAFGLDGHFAVEQRGRTAANHFTNFNGTAGVWRKTTIEDAGGWEHDTLTEDLDLSYRAQIKGWKFQYLEDVVSPAELPITVSALKNQQHRWMKGGAECFKKMWKRMLTAEGVSFSNKLHGLSHLFNSSVFFFIMIMSLLSLPILHIKDSFSDLNFIIKFGSIFIFGTVFLFYFYWLSYRDKTENKVQSFFKYCWSFLKYLTVIMGLTLNNFVAVLEGYLGIKSSFVRTPKFNVASKDEFKGNKYDKKKISLLTILEGVLMAVFGFTAVNRAIYGDLGMVPFHTMLAIGYGVIFFNSMKELKS